MSNLYNKHHIWFPLVVFVSMMTIAGTVTFKVPGRAAGASGALPPMIAFTDLTSGPSTGNSDNSQSGQTAGQDGAIVTVWGKYLGSSQGTSQILVNGTPARIYAWGNADHTTGVADLYSRLGMQMVAFQIPHAAPSGNVTIQANVGGTLSNSLPFTVRPGNIYFVKTTGNDATGDGSWAKPWQHLAALNDPNPPVDRLVSGDILYLGDGVQQTVEAGDRSAMNLDTVVANIGTATLPKALVGYPGARAMVGSAAYGASWSTWIQGGGGVLSEYWTISKLSLTGNQGAATMQTGFRVVGNYVTAPTGDQPTGAITGVGDHLYLFGNEVTNTGYAGGSKLYHPIYFQSTECNDTSCLPKGLSRLPTEVDREIAWNYLHDNASYDGINIYREGTYSAYMNNLRVHDNYILNQNGRGMLIGEFITGTDNYIYNNVIDHAGSGPAPAGQFATDPAWAYVCANIQAGAPGAPTTIIHFYNNTLYGCGYGGGPADTGAMLGIDQAYPFTLDFHNNIIQSTGFPFIQPYSVTTGVIAKNNIWFGPGGSIPDPKATEIFAGALTGDPKFVNAATGDFHLQAGSAAIDAGSAIAPVPSVDFDDAARPQGAGYDIGAFEYGSGVTTTGGSGGGTGGTTPSPVVTPPSSPSSSLDTLGVTLVSSVTSGTAPLSISLTAKITGSATGNTSYAFYCDRADAGTNVTSPSDLSVTAASGTAYTASNVCVYQNPGTYITKVIAQRGNAPAAQAQAQVVVSPAPIPTPVLPPTPTSTPVLIQSVKVSQITPTTAAVTIILNQVASVVINYGPTTAYGSAMQPSPYLSTVYANLTNLTPGTVYDFNVMAMAQGSSAPVTSGNYVFQTQANPIVPTPIPTPSSTASSNYFPRNLKYGDMGSDVKLLNTVLANLTYLSAQNSSSSRFSAATEHALLLFQRAHDINRSGFLDLQSQLLLNKTITANPKLTNGITPTGINFVPPFTQNLKLGSNGSQVTLLQELLREDGEYDFSNRISGYYGVATVVAVKNFQGKYNLVSAQAGVVDSITRTKLNSVYQTIIQK